MNLNKTRSPPPLLPPLLASFLKRLPAYPGSMAFARALNGTLATQLPLDVALALEGKRLRLRVSDAGLCFDFAWRGRGFHALAPNGKADLTIGSTLRDLLLMAGRDEDPDSLFFSRRLTLEGDTELGLLFKNTMDAIEFTAVDLFLRWLRAFPGSAKA
jgi:predicted lipid carrier protein YhbT